jgi:hypothetical protein
MNLFLVSWSLNSLDIILQSKPLFLHVICTELCMQYADRIPIIFIASKDEVLIS